MNKAEYGVHVIKFNSEDKNHYIIPLCPECSKQEGSFTINTALVSASINETCGKADKRPLNEGWNGPQCFLPGCLDQFMRSNFLGFDVFFRQGKKYPRRAAEQEPLRT